MLYSPEITISTLKSRIRFFVGLLLLGVIAIMIWHVSMDRKAAITAAEMESQGYALALSEHATSAFAEADRALRELVTNVLEKGGIESVDRVSLFYMIRRQSSDTPQIGSIFLVDRSGTMYINSYEFPSKQIDVSDREYFKYNRDTPGAGLFISRPLTSRLVGRWRFTMTRPFTDHDGRFAGLAAVGFETEYFMRFAKSINLGPNGKIYLIRLDGAPLVSHPFSENDFSTDFSQSSLFMSRLKAAQAGTIHGSLKGGASPSAIISFQQLKRFPVIAVVAMDLNDILGKWAAKVYYEVSLTLGLCLVILLITWLLFHHLNRLETAQNSLRDYQEQLRIKAAQIDAANDAILLVEKDDRLVHFNNAFCQMVGYEPDELFRKKLQTLKPPELAEQHGDNLRQVLEKGEGTYDTTYLTKSGTKVQVEVHAKAMDTDGTTRVLAILRDVSERKKSERREQTRLLILEEIATGASLNSLMDHIVYFVEQEQEGALCSILLVDESGLHFCHGSAPSLPEFYNRAVNGIRIGEGIGSCGTAAYRRKRVIVEDIDGHPFWKGFKPAYEAGLRSCWSEPVISSQGEVLGTFAIYHRWPSVPNEAQIILIESAAHLASIAIERSQAEEQKKHLEEQLNHIQRIEAIGQLAGGIAHDFNNLLTPIIGYAGMIQRQAADNSSVADKASHIISAAGKARDLTQQLLSFGRKQMLVMKPVDLNGIISGFQDIMRRTIRENIALKLQLSPGSIAIRADQGQVEQILLNLAVNAQDAIPGNGTIVVETGHVVLDNEYVRIHPGMQPGPYALLAFTDNGCGMNDETLRHIFEPFFTTKQVGQGTGLGLATVYGIIKQHDGSVTVRSRVGEGTTFSIYLPISQESVAETPGAAAAAPGVKTLPGRKTILVVEDNEMVLTLVVDVLETHGCKVLTASLPSIGLELAQSNRDDIALLITDVVMPEMSGQDMYEKIAQDLPDLKVLYISGYTNELLTRNGALMEAVNFLQKPFTTERFIERVQKLMND